MITSLILALGMLANEPAPTSHDVYGHWFTPDRQSIVEIRDCGDGTPCGNVVWIDGDPHGDVRDHANRDRALRERPLLGAPLLSSFDASEEAWVGGEIYNPENGKTYRAVIERLDPTHLRVKGCVGPICKAFVWAAADRP